MSVMLFESPLLVLYQQCILMLAETFSCVKNLPVDGGNFESVSYQNWMRIDEHNQAEKWEC